MICMSYELLRMQPPTFWSQLDIDAANEDIVRALLHKARIFAEKYGASAIPISTRQSLQHYFTHVASMPVRRKVRWKKWKKWKTWMRWKKWWSHSQNETVMGTRVAPLELSLSPP